MYKWDKSVGKFPMTKKTKGGKVQSSKLKEVIERERKKSKQERQRQQAGEKGTNYEAAVYMHKKSLQESKVQNSICTNML